MLQLIVQYPGLFLVLLIIALVIICAYVNKTIFLKGEIKRGKDKLLSQDRQIQELFTFIKSLSLKHNVRKNKERSFPSFDLEDNISYIQNQFKEIDVYFSGYAEMYKALSWVASKNNVYLHTPSDAAEFIDKIDAIIKETRALYDEYRIVSAQNVNRIASMIADLKLLELKKYESIDVELRRKKSPLCEQYDVLYSKLPKATKEYRDFIYETKKLQYSFEILCKAITKEYPFFNIERLVGYIPDEVLNNSRAYLSLSQLEEEKVNLQQDIVKLKDEYQEIVDTAKYELCQLREEYKSILEKFYTKIKEHSPNVIESLSLFATDIYSIGDKYIEQRLLSKQRPAIKAAEIVKELRLEKKSLIAQLKTMQYEYELLQQQLPNFTKYCSSIEEVVEDISIEGNNANKIFHWLTTAEYQGLSEEQKIQLALDRYNTSLQKSNRRIGYDYELYCGYHLRQGNIWKLREDKPLSVIQYGIEQGLEDQGRDIIAQYRDGKVCIIQCKRWRRDKLIRENVIMQLFGSAAEYCYKHYSNSYNPISKLYNTVIPVLITTTNLSDTAKNFAIRLGIKVVMFDWDLQLHPYPQIKCNINHGNKIYHLPFDDQYDRTVIDESAGEFYAFTVEEAERKGFRHAMKYYNNYDR